MWCGGSCPQQEGVTPGATAATGVRLLIPNSQVGSIIGKGGAVIKELQEQSGGMGAEGRCQPVGSRPPARVAHRRAGLGTPSVCRVGGRRSSSHHGIRGAAAAVHGAHDHCERTDPEHPQGRV